MAFKPEEITWFQTTADEMAKRIEDIDTTSNEAAVAYSRIGRICMNAIASDAALSAKRTTRSTHVIKFQTARQARVKKNTPTTQAQGTPPRQQSSGA